MSIDLTVAVTTHAEDFLLRPTLRSVAIAIQELSSQGREVELLIILDRPTDLTRGEAARWVEAGRVSFPVRTYEVDFGESGASRNAAAKEARGTFLAFCDGDDLVSRNFFVVAYELAATRAEPTIVHPETVLSFGERALVWKVRSGDDPELGYRDLLDSNLWPSSSLARRQIYLEQPYPSLEPGSGFGPEDYAWNISTSIAGIRHVTAPESAFFYRVRARGGVNNSHVSSILPFFSIPELRTGFPRREPEINEAASHTRHRLDLHDAVKRLRPLARPIGSLIPRPLRTPIRRRAVHYYGRTLQMLRPTTPATPSFLLAIKEAAELEPALSWTANGAAHLDSWVPPREHYGAVLESMVSALTDTEALILAPWLGIGGADLVTANYGAAISSARLLTGKVSILTTYLPERTLTDAIPSGVRHYQLEPEFRSWPIERQQRLIAQLVVLVKPSLIISINCFDFTNALRVYARPICADSTVYLSLFAFDRIGVGNYPVNPITDDSQREFLHEIDGIITDNTVTASLISEILGVDEPFVQVHHQSAGVPVYDFDEVVKQTAAYYDSTFSKELPFRVMWPHRLDKEKRPDSLLRIAQQVATERLPIQFHVWGQRILNNGNDDLLPALAAANVIYHGPYSGGLPALPTKDFHALLLTSESEGMPLVLAQSLLLGLPVVASAVGGVVDLVVNNKTGLLADGPDDIEGFIAALTRLMESRDLRRSLIRAGYESAAAQHGIPAFTERTLKSFGISQAPSERVAATQLD